jgi:glyoxylase-like metal-dependent hydrolase (beta-lactamase superfamily II)
MILETVKVGPMQVNCYLLASRPGGRAMIIDPGDDAAKIKAVLKKHNLTPAMVVNTHGHYDHIGADDEFGVLVYVHREDLEMLTDPEKNLSAVFSTAYKVDSKIEILKEDDLVRLDDIELRVVYLPGHTMGGIGLLMEKPQKDIIFTGDTLFFRGIGRSDLPGGDPEKLEISLREKLFVLPPETKVYPGHGPATTIGGEDDGCLPREL